MQFVGFLLYKYTTVEQLEEIIYSHYKHLHKTEYLSGTVIV